MNKNTLAQIGRILLSFLFVFGAVSKLVSMPFFDGMVAELLLGKDYFDNPVGMIWVQWLTRILVAAELVLGLALLQNKWFKKIVLPATLGMLVLFTIHLFYEGFRQVNGFTEGNCGCFGDVLPMTNLESIIKNVIGMLIGIYVLLTFKKEDVFKSWVSPTLLGVITLFTLSFGIKSYEAVAPSVLDELGTIPAIELMQADSIAQAAIAESETIIAETEIDVTEKIINKPSVDSVKTSKVVSVKTPSDLTLELLYKYAPSIKSQNLASGIKMVCLFSMTCSHCQEVYRDLSAMKSSGKLPELFLVNYGTEYEQNYFFSQAGDSKDAHTRTEDFTHFKRMLEGKTYPRILVIKNGKIEKEWDVDTYEKSYVMRYFGIEKLEEKKSGGLQLELQSGGSPW
ncbi:MAG: DoxX family protein [Bacteroidetes bacterium]|nr:DoxX family protein [Bacteroidota bacterium]